MRADSSVEGELDEQHAAVPLAPIHAPGCAVCGRTIPPEQEVTALIPDSSVVDPHDSSRDGQRMVSVCSDDELPELIAAGRAAWQDEQLWLGQLSRASTEPGVAEMSLRMVARRAFLTDEQLYRVLAWNEAQPVPESALPGGQPLRRPLENSAGVPDPRVS
jgi:hypothetical protein